MLGILAKTWLPEKMNLDVAHPRDLAHAVHGEEGLEAVRAQLRHGEVPEIDVVLTVREFVRLLRREGVDFAAIEPSVFDNPYMSDSNT